MALKAWTSALVIAPCTGATLARLAAGLSDTPVTLAAKSLLRVGCPVVVGVSTNDGLGASADEETIQRLCGIFETCCRFDLRFWDMVYAMGENGDDP